MNKLLINISRNHLAPLASAALIIFAAVLTVSAVMAQPSSKTVGRGGACENWPSDQDKQAVKDAFTKALNDSAIDTPDGHKLRKQLLDPRDCYKAPKAAVQKILNDLKPDSHIVFPKDTLIVFYEPEEPVSKNHITFDQNYPSDHCLHIFYLPRVGTPAARTASFENNIMCCYKPW